MVTFLFSVHTITKASNTQGGGSSSQVIWPGVPWCSTATASEKQNGIPKRPDYTKTGKRSNPKTNVSSCRLASFVGHQQHFLHLSVMETQHHILRIWVSSCLVKILKLVHWRQIAWLTRSVHWVDDWYSGLQRGGLMHLVRCTRFYPTESTFL